MTNHYYALIMAGGIGTRLWPMSRRDHPKQVLSLIDDRSMFKISVERLQPLFQPQDVFVVTGREHVGLLQAEGTGIPDRNFIVEPMGRGTAPAIGLSAITLRKRDPQAVMVVLTADHFISDEAGFRKVLEAARQVAEIDYLVTLGVTPAFPATGYGYIERGEALTTIDGLTAYKVEAFREKPDAETAARFLKAGRYSWNAGMFVWKVDRFLAELSRTMPDFYQQLLQIAQALDTPQADALIKKTWPEVKPQTVDYGVMEKAQGVTVIPAEFGWSDIGSWDALFDILPGDEHGNVVRQAEQLGYDTTNTLIVGRKRLVATVGLHDMIIIDAGDVIFVCPKDRAQDVKKLVDELKNQGRAQYL
jgi:mannose-1-phosphate guanylyltransferase